MSQVLIFQNHPIRSIAENNQVWFVAKDVCAALSISWTSATLKPLPDEWKGVMNFITPSGNYRGGGKQRLSVISEQGVYMLAFRSNKEEALALTKWVAGEVLPAIRKTGRYEARPQQLSLPAEPPADIFTLRADMRARVRDLFDTADRLRSVTGRTGTGHAVMHSLFQDLSYTVGAIEEFADDARRVM